MHTIQNKQQLDNSISFKKTFDSLLIKSQTPGTNKLQRTNKKSPNSRTQQGKSPTIKKKVDALNQWSYCNPENIEDPLPQPFRFVNKVLQDMILKPVYQQIFDIEKYKNNPNYEGNVREIYPQGNFQINGVTSMCKHNGNPNNHVIAGDRFGNIYVLDMNKKTQLFKQVSVENKRIQHISSVTLPYVDQHMTTAAVIARGHNIIQIYRSLTQENKLCLHFTIKLTEEQTAESKYGDYPYQSSISEDSTFIQISNYKGDVKIYRIPEPPKPELEQQYMDESNVLGIPNQNQAPITQRLQQMNLEQEPVEIKEVFYEMKFEGEQKLLDYDNYLKKLQEESKNKYKEKEPVDPKAAAKDAKKDTKKAGKGQQQQQEEENEGETLGPEKEFNENNVFPEYKFSEKLGDISEEIPKPKYEPHSYFQQSQMTVLNQERTFNKPHTLHLTTHLIICWTNTKSFQQHVLQPNKPEYLSEYVYNIYFGDMNSINKQEVMKKALPFFPPKLIKTSEVLYPISQTAVSTGYTMLAFGLKNGTILVWDLLLQCEKWYLDKHLQQVSALAFFENYKLVSGSIDGGVHIYNLEKGKMEMKRTNLFNVKEEYSILDIKVSNVGVAFVIDSFKNLRMYDIYHGDKIAKIKLSPQRNYPCSFVTEPKLVMDAQREQLAIIAEVQLKKFSLNDDSDEEHNIDEGEKQEQQENKDEEEEMEGQNDSIKQSNIFMFKIHEAFLNLFPGYSNVYNKMGYQTDKRLEIINIFGRLSMEDLKNPQFEIPSLLPQTSLTLQVQGTVSKKNISSGNTMSMSKKQSVLQKPAGSMLQSQKASQVIIQNNSQKYGRQAYSPNKSGVIVQSPAQARMQQSFSDISEIDLNSSYKTHMTQITGKKSLKQKQGLTKEQLHPEQALLEKVKLPVDSLVDGTRNTIEESRKRNPAKNQREARLAKKLTQIKQELQLREEDKYWKKKKKMLKK